MDVCQWRMTPATSRIRLVVTRQDPHPPMNASVTALIFVGLLLTLLGLLVAGSLPLIGLGAVTLLSAGVLEAVAARAS
jgi:hypothetical protein